MPLILALSTGDVRFLLNLNECLLTGPGEVLRYLEFGFMRFEEPLLKALIMGDY